MRAIDHQLVEYVKNKIVERFHPRRIMVFGSYARGEVGPDSDLDLIVEMETDKPAWKQAVEIGELFGLRDWGMDILVYRPEEFERESRIIGTLPSMIADEFRVVYERT